MTRQPRKVTPVETDETDWRVPRTNGKYFEALPLVPKNGSWYVVGSGLGLTTGEQLARTMNHPDSNYAFGYRVYSDATGQLVSDLAVRYISPTTGGTNP